MDICVLPYPGCRKERRDARRGTRTFQFSVFVFFE